jgi:hypothetical protein
MPSISIFEVLRIVIMASVLFVWVVRYENIVLEFKQYNLPNWLRDLVGILKISFVIMLNSDDSALVLLAASGIIFLMLAALITHLRIKNPVSKMLPAFSLMLMSIAILIGTI